jgi:4-hydroxy-tetrahydrodipicolinate synthase
MFKPSGIYAAMLTPFKADGSINEAVIRQMVDFMIAKGLQGIFPISSVGEFAHLSLEEIYRYMEIVVEQAQGRVHIMPGAGSTCAANSIKIANRAKALGCEAVVICPPYYYPISQENLQKYYEDIADAVDIPVILYNIPLFITPISQQVIINLSKHTNIVALKDSSGSMVDLMHYIYQVNSSGSNYNVLVGREDMLAPALAVGAKGCIVACAGIVPEIMVGIWDAYYAGDWKKALRIQNVILPLIQLMFKLPFPIGFKIALELRGFAMGPFKQSLSAAEQVRVSAVTTEIKADLQEILDFIVKEGLDKAKKTVR